MVERCCVCNGQAEHALDFRSREQDEPNNQVPFCLKHALEMQAELNTVMPSERGSFTFYPALPDRGGLRPEA